MFKEAKTIKRLDVEEAPVGKISHYWLDIINNK